MKKYLLSLAILFVTVFINNCFAQAGGQQFTTNGKGTIFKEHGAGDIEGTPNLFEGWMQGKAVTEKGVVYNNLLFKYDIYDDLPLFATEETDSPKTFDDPIRSFVIKGETDMFFSNGFPAVDNYTPNSYYQVLSEGKTMLLKHYVKVVMENTAYGFTVITKKYTSDAKYYIFAGNKITPVKNTKTGILAALSDKQPQLNLFVKTNAINFKNDADLKKLLNYYNTL